MSHPISYNSIDKLIFKGDSEAGAVAAEAAALGTVAAYPLLRHAARMPGQGPLLRHAGLPRPAGLAGDWPPEAESWNGRPREAAAAVGESGGTATAVPPKETTGGRRPHRTGRGIAATEETERREDDVQLVTCCG